MTLCHILPVVEELDKYILWPSNIKFWAVIIIEIQSVDWTDYLCPFHC